MKSKINAVQAHAFNNKYEIRVYRDNGTVRAYSSPYTDSNATYRLGKLFYLLNSLVGNRLLTERITWWERLNGKS